MTSTWSIVPRTTSSTSTNDRLSAGVPPVLFREVRELTSLVADSSVTPTFGELWMKIRLSAAIRPPDCMTSPRVRTRRSAPVASVTSPAKSTTPFSDSTSFTRFAPVVVMASNVIPVLSLSKLTI